MQCDRSLRKVNFVVVVIPLFYLKQFRQKEKIVISLLTLSLLDLLVKLRKLAQTSEISNLFIYHIIPPH